MERRLQAVSIMTLQVVLFSAANAFADGAKTPERAQQAGLSKWVDRWRESRPATREVADALNSELIWAPLKPTPSPRPRSTPSAALRRGAAKKMPEIEPIASPSPEEATVPDPGATEPSASTQQFFPGRR